ncbi:hypothetical protein [Paraglaciecola marina]|uniref:hypothetical protein n=1 Tax=Paraglaciecola marina TaxID=2500157 RepID=UPI001060AB4A|nr:hypothetical protein [Paraglaciecola marina]
MYKKISCITLLILLTSCSTMTSESTKKDKDESDKHLGVNGMKEFETDPTVVLRETNKVKCQEARMDMVDAEAKGDVGEVRLVKARLQKYCVPDE